MMAISSGHQPREAEHKLSLAAAGGSLGYIHSCRYRDFALPVMPLAGEGEMLLTMSTARRRAGRGH
jgi:hypothetical protein